MHLVCSSYWIWVPRRFIAGAVYYSEADECLEGTTMTLKYVSGEKVASVNTDNFCDFWFEGLKKGKYTLKIEAKGYVAKRIEAISTEEKDVNLGDIPLSK